MKYFVHNNIVEFANHEPKIAHETIPAENYLLSFAKIGFYLDIKATPKTIEKYYGGTVEKVKRVLNKFKFNSGQNKSLGAMFCGAKGCGKTLTVDLLCKEAITTWGYPVINIEQNFGDYIPDMITWLNKIDQPVVIVFAELDKYFEDKKQQNMLLEFLTGTGAAPRLVCATANEYSSFSDYYQNRPGRFFYWFKFNYIDHVIAEEFFNDNVNNKEFISDILKHCKLIQSLNYDIMQAIADEVNQTNEPLSKFIDILNIQYTDGIMRNMFLDSLTIDGVDFSKLKTDDNIDGHDTLYHTTRLWFKKESLVNILEPDDKVVGIEDEGEDKKDSLWVLAFSPEHIRNYNAITGDTVYFAKVDGHELVCCLKGAPDRRKNTLKRILA